MPEVLIPLIVVPTLFIALPWLIFHYVSKWKTASALTTEDEKLLDELYELARRLDDRMSTIERIVQAENPNWRSVAVDPIGSALEDRSARILEDNDAVVERIDRSNRPNRRN